MAQTLVTVAEYQLITGDSSTASSSVTARLEEALDLVQEELGGRLLESAVRSETCEVWFEDGLAYVYPLATPVTAVTSPTGAVVDELVSRIRGVTLDILTGTMWPLPGTPVDPYRASNRPAYATISYTGGYSHDDLPVRLRRAIALVARGLVAPPSLVPVGATSVRVGDVAVGYGAAGATGGPLEDLAPGVTKLLRGYQRRRVRH